MLNLKKIVSIVCLKRHLNFPALRMIIKMTKVGNLGEIKTEIKKFINACSGK